MAGILARMMARRQIPQNQTFIARDIFSELPGKPTRDFQITNASQIQLPGTRAAYEYVTQTYPKLSRLIHFESSGWGDLESPFSSDELAFRDRTSALLSHGKTPGTRFSVSVPTTPVAKALTLGNPLAASQEALIAKSIASKLGIGVSQVTPELMEAFSVLHEFGHIKTIVDRFGTIPLGGKRLLMPKFLLDRMTSVSLQLDKAKFGRDVRGGMSEAEAYRHMMHETNADSFAVSAIQRGGSAFSQFMRGGRSDVPVFLTPLGSFYRPNGTERDLLLVEGRFSLDTGTYHVATQNGVLDADVRNAFDYPTVRAAQVAMSGPVNQAVSESRAPHPVYELDSTSPTLRTKVPGRPYTPRLASWTRPASTVIPVTASPSAGGQTPLRAAEVPGRTRRAGSRLRESQRTLSGHLKESGALGGLLRGMRRLR